jgi:4-hydroxyphenylacetaldehyde oxime monooxygenase
MAFSPYKAYWYDMRRVLPAELLGARRVWAACAARREQVQKLVAVLGDLAARSAPLEMDELIYGAADGMVDTVAFGRVYDAATFAGRYRRFEHVLDEAMDVLSGFAAEDFFPNAACRLADNLAGTIAWRERESL